MTNTSFRKSSRQGNLPAGRNGLRPHNTKDAYRDCFERDLTIHATAIELGVSESAVRSMRRRLAAKKDVETYRGADHADYEDCARMGMTVDETAAYLCVSKNAVKWAAQRGDLIFKGQAPKPEEGPVRFEDLSEETKRRVRQRVAEGYSYLKALRIVIYESTVLRDKKADQSD